MCYWETFIYNTDVPFIINSNEEFENYFWCSNGSNPVYDIDFNNYTLLLIGGHCPTEPSWVTAAIFSKYGMYQYTLDLKIDNGEATMPSVWHFAILIPKITNEVTITLNITLLNF
jgi:hypothetical protein